MTSTVVALGSGAVGGAGAGLSIRWKALAVLAIVATAVAVRLPIFGFESDDYRVFLSSWIQFIESNGGFSALEFKFSDYNMPYLYILAALTYIPAVSPLVGIKIVSVVFDLLLAYFVYKLVSIRHPAAVRPVVAATAVLLLPTVVTNSAMWGQCDSIYAAFALGGLYFAVTARPQLSCVFFGLALAFKLQTVFVLPVLLVLLLLRKVSWRHLLLIPGVVLVLDIPAILLGADLGHLLLLYVEQAGQYPKLTIYAPNVYQFLTFTDHSDLLRLQGIAVTGALVLWIVALLVARRTSLDAVQMVLLATVFAIAVPFFLPSMHSRYFYLADVLTVVLVCWCPRRPGLWFAAVLVQFASFFANAVHLRETWPDGPVDFRVLALAMAGALVLIVRELFATLGPNPAPATPAPRA